MKTAGFKMAFISGLMGLAYSSREVAEIENSVEVGEQSSSIEESPTTIDVVSMDQSETNLP